MAGKTVVNQVQLGDSAISTQNFVLQTNIDGTGVLAAGNAGATTKDLAKVSATGITGLSFAPTQVPSADPNTLDDYEEGSFTPTFLLSTPGTSSFTYAINSGVYTKIGRVVAFQVQITTTVATVGTGTGTLSVSGLPFVSSALLAASITVGYAASFTGAQPTQALILTNHSDISIYIGGVQFNQANLGTSMSLYLSGSYIV
jgi:hypothetical protein